MSARRFRRQIRSLMGASTAATAGGIAAGAGCAAIAPEAGPACLAGGAMISNVIDGLLASTSSSVAYPAIVAEAAKLPDPAKLLAAKNFIDAPQDAAGYARFGQILNWTFLEPWPVNLSPGMPEHFSITPGDQLTLALTGYDVPVFGIGPGALTPRQAWKSWVLMYLSSQYPHHTPHIMAGCPSGQINASPQGALRNCVPLSSAAGQAALAKQKGAAPAAPWSTKKKAAVGTAAVAALGGLGWVGYRLLTGAWT